MRGDYSGKIRVTLSHKELASFGRFIGKNPKLNSALDELQILYFYTTKVLAPAEFVVYDSYRAPDTQEKLLKEGKSEDVHSLHNLNPSHACDHVPIVNGKAQWKAYKQFHFIYGIMYTTFQKLKHDNNWQWNIRSGMDWEMDNYTEDKTTLYDPGHIELRPLDYKPNS